MKVTLTADDLIKFEDDVCRWFNDKQVLAPVHLDNGNEKPLIQIFENHVNEDDWCCGSWRMHYKALLKGVPPAAMEKAIKEGRSISLCFSEYRVVASAIVGGILPIAVGTAMGIKRQGGTNKVVCFLGEMTAETGIFHECLKYSLNFDLPILFVIEDNGKSVCTPTLPTWGMTKLTHEPVGAAGLSVVNEKLYYFKYDSKYPHAGTGARIQF